MAKLQPSFPQFLKWQKCEGTKILAFVQTIPVQFEKDGKFNDDNLIAIFATKGLKAPSVDK